MLRSLVLLLAACAAPSVPEVSDPAGTAPIVAQDVGPIEAVSRALMLNLRPNRPVELRVVPASAMSRPGVLGMTWLDERGVLILEVLGEQPLAGVLDTLIHEWAHALAWDCAGEADPHGEVWGVLFSRCYRVALDAWMEWARSRPGKGTEFLGK